MQVHLAFHHFNVFATWLTEVLWYLDVENKTGFFINTKETKSPLSIMHVAVRDENVQAVKFFIEYLKMDKNPGVQIENVSKGKTPLHLAAQLGNLEMVQLIKSCLNLINPTDERGWSVIHLAAANGHLDIVKEIAKDLDQKDPKAGDENWTPFHLAAIQGHLEIAKYLHEVGSDMCITEKNGWNALDLARQNNHHSTVVFLCQYPLFAAINKVSRLGNFEELRKLFQELNKEDPFDKKLFDETSPLHEAAKGGHVNIMDFFQNNLPSMSILDSSGTLCC
jgi:ankyrin repeat protein